MIFEPTAAAPSPVPRILVVDDDHRVVELLEVAFAAHGFRVITAADGEEAIKRVLGDRPDLVVLDVRLPRKSGLEVCEQIRRDPDDPHVPIILVSAASETEARLQAFRRGADDYLSKPFSPKELIARTRRLLVRSGEATEARRRARALELEVAHARDDANRAHAERRREQHLRELAFGLGRELCGSLDLEAVLARLLLAVQSRFGASMVAALVPAQPGGPFVATAVRGDGFERVAGIELARCGEIATLLAGLDRPMRTREFERFPELRDEIPTLVSGGITLLAPLCGPRGLEAVLVADERRDGRDLSGSESEMLAAMCRMAAVAVRNALRFDAPVDATLATLALHAAPADDTVRRVAIEEAAALVDRAARALWTPPALRRRLAHAAALGAWGRTPECGQALARLAPCDPTGRIEALVAFLGHAPHVDAADVRTERLYEIAVRYAERRARGESMGVAVAALVPDIERPELRDALRAAAHDLIEHPGRAA